MSKLDIGPRRRWDWTLFKVLLLSALVVLITAGVVLVIG